MQPEFEERSFGVVPVWKDVDGRVLFLLIQHHSGHWAFPKGHAHIGETDIEAALRELREEAGISQVTLLTDQPFIERYRKPAAWDPRAFVNKTVHYYLGLARDRDVRVQPAEIRDYRWVNLDEAAALITYDENRRILYAAAAALGLLP